METKKIVKRVYEQPIVNVIKLDNEISLALESDAPVGPGEGQLIAPVYLNNDPFKDGLC